MYAIFQHGGKAMDVGCLLKHGSRQNPVACRALVP